MQDAGRIPIIKLRGNLIVSIQVALSDRLVMRLKDDITRAIEVQAPRGLAIDVSGIDILDSYISRAIRDIGLMARLMGVETVICGLAPSMAMTLVEMGMNLEGVAAEQDLESALDLLDRRTTAREGGRSESDDPRPEDVGGGD